MVNRLHVVLDPDAVTDAVFFKKLPSIASAIATLDVTVQVRIKTRLERIPDVLGSLSKCSSVVVNTGLADHVYAGRHHPEASLPVVSRSGLVGASIHDVDGLVKAVGADYVFFGPVYDAGSKPVRGQGLDVLANVARVAPMPVIAIGGVTPDRVAACRRAGAFGVAALTSVLLAADPAAVIHQFNQRLEESCRT